MGSLNRRDFLKALGLGGGVSALSACGLDDNRYITPVEQLLPYVLKNEFTTPGAPTFFATTVTSGPAAWPVSARHRDGRVVNVGANARAPMAPGVPTAALLSLQRTYSPDRYTAPRKNDGGSWSAIEWQAGLEQLASAVKAARAEGKTVAYLGPYRSGSIVGLLNDYTEGNAVFWEPLGPDAEAEAARILFGERLLPAYDLSEAKYVLSFGASFLGSWGGTALEAQYAKARNPNEGHFITRFALVSPHMDQTGANADDWYAAVPGTEAMVARAIAKLVAAKKGYTGAAMALLESANIDAAASASGIAKADIDAMASQLAEGKTVALPGGVAASGAQAVDLAVATYLINIVSGNAGTTFGTGTHYAGPIDGWARLQALLADMKAGKVGVLLLDDANPAYALPTSAGVTEALAGVGTIVAVNSHADETNANAHLLLPTNDALEDWGDEEPAVGTWLLRQPAMSPVHDTRSLGDILLVTARAAGLTVAPAADEAPAGLGFTPEDWRGYIAARWQADVFPVAGHGDFAQWFRSALIDGVVQSGATLAAPQLAGSHAFSGAPAAYDGSGEFYLVAFPHAILGDGRYANEPWAQEAADPITGEMWGSWIEISEATAARLGLERNTLVEITTAAGAISAGLHPRPGLRDDVIALAFGQGHTALGRYSTFGVNVADLLASKDGVTFAWQQAKAGLRSLGTKADLASTLGSDRLDGRPIAVLAPAAALAEVGDAPSKHPGELTGIHHLPRDQRLQDANVLHFYDAPEHPVHRWAMTIDTNACNGCGVCSIACYAENNLPVIGKALAGRGKEMNWLRVNRYWHDEGGQPAAHFLPMMCQQCSRAPCESVCPVLATYHNLEGLNAMVYNRCVGTRYCANNCPYQARRFNFHSYQWPEPFNLQLNPDVATRAMGIMEKCTFCVQRTRAVKSALKDHGHTGPVPNEYLEQLPACAEACPSQAIRFGNLNDESSIPATTRKSGRSYLMFEELYTEPGINYLAKASFHADAAHGVHHLGDASEGGDHGADHGDAAHGAPAPSHPEPAPHGAGAH